MPKQAEWSPLGLPTPQALAGLAKDAPVLLGLSGGADSRALLHILSLQAARDGFSVTLAHVNHGIRGEEALRDRAFCQALAEQYGFEICILDADVPALAAEHGRGLEEEARTVRYAYFSELMQSKNIRLLATAHHADDQLETMLFRLCRGSGTKGFGGMSPVRPMEGGCYLVRPMLSLPSREIRAFCEREGLSFVTDSTNEDAAYARNRIRREIVPVMESLFDTPQRRAAALAEDLREDEAFLSSLAEGVLLEAGQGAGLLLSALAKAPAPVLRRVLLRWCERETGRTPERVHIEALIGLIEAADPSAEVALPNGVVAAIESGCLVHLAEPDAKKDYRIAFCEGETVITEAGFCICVEKCTESTKINNLSTESGINLYLKSAIMKDGLFWRPRREGDRLLLHGMHKKLRRLYREAGITPRTRARIPLLCDGEGIVWAPFVGVRDRLDTEGEAYKIQIKTI